MLHHFALVALLPRQQAGAPDAAAKRSRSRRHRDGSARLSRRRAECLRGSRRRRTLRTYGRRDLGRGAWHDIPPRLAGESRDRARADGRTARSLWSDDRSADASRVRVVGRPAVHCLPVRVPAGRGAAARRTVRRAAQRLRRRGDRGFGANAPQLRIARRLHGRRSGDRLTRRRRRQAPRRSTAAGERRARGARRRFRHAHPNDPARRRADRRGDLRRRTNRLRQHSRRSKADAHAAAGAPVLRPARRSRPHRRPRNRRSRHGQSCRPRDRHGSPRHHDRPTSHRDRLE